MTTDILDVDYTDHVELLGTAHFTRRSIREAQQAASRKTPRDLALELDKPRFRILNSLDASEFMEGSDALGCVDANIWLIDMDEPEKGWRIRTLMTVQERKNLRFLPWISRGSIDDPVLWERGLKDTILDRNREKMEQLRTHLPSIRRVMMDERSALMAGRLAWIATQRIRRDQREPKILGLGGPLTWRG